MEWFWFAPPLLLPLNMKVIRKGWNRHIRNEAWQTLGNRSFAWTHFPWLIFLKISKLSWQWLSRPTRYHIALTFVPEGAGNFKLDPGTQQVYFKFLACFVAIDQEHYFMPLLFFITTYVAISQEYFMPVFFFIGTRTVCILGEGGKINNMW